MRPRFLVVEGGHAHRLFEQGRSTLSRRRDGQGIILFTTDDCPVIEMPAVGGWIVGPVFTPDGSTPIQDLAPAQQLAIMSTNGRWLIDHVSGAYVAFWRGCGAAPLMALRDPSACLPAFMTSTPDSVAIFSDIDIMDTAAILSARPDVAGIARHLRFPLVPSDTTCLVDVLELTPGAVSCPSGAVPTQLLWRPSRYADRRSSDPALIAAAIDNVVAGQMSGSKRPGIELSGGLDSSIVAAAMPTGSRATALHIVPAAQDGDERRYARAVLDRHGIPAIEIPIGLEDVDILRPPTRLTARPVGVAHFGSIDEKLQDATATAGLDAVFSGAGGDSVFCGLSSTGLVIDAWRDGGFALARETLGFVASLAGVTRWEAARHLVRRMTGRLWRRWQWPAVDSLLGPVGLAATPPDASRLADLPPGALAHVASILRMQTLLDTHSRMAIGSMRFPLMAQPVLEACIATPSWRWSAHARDRAAAREAYVGRVPDLILQRSGKGRYDSLLIRAYESARPALRELLLGGWLSGQGLIDRVAVAKALDEPVTATTSTHSRIIAIADAESWCRMVLDRQRVARPR